MDVLCKMLHGCVDVDAVVALVVVMDIGFDVVVYVALRDVDALVCIVVDVAANEVDVVVISAICGRRC